MNSHSVSIRKEAFKFASAHMTVFPDGTKEALHGHNYTTEVTFEVKDIRLKNMISFSDLKKPVREICGECDEKVLLPANCPFLETISKSADEIEFQLCKKRYVLPIEEVVLLPTDNITAESLSEEFARRLVNSLASLGILNSFLGIRVRVDESPGQGASFVWVPEVKR